MPAPPRSRHRWLLVLGGAAGLAGLLWTRVPRPDASAAGGHGGGGAAAELARTRREQALIRAEPTAELLRLLEARRKAPEGGP